MGQFLILQNEFSIWVQKCKEIFTEMFNYMILDELNLIEK